MKIDHWVKIGEVDRSGGQHLWRGWHRRYAVMEFIENNGDRRYKEVFMCSWTADNTNPVLKSQPETSYENQLLSR
jgi:hypothetical protein